MRTRCLPMSLWQLSARGFLLSNSQDGSSVWCDLIESVPTFLCQRPGEAPPHQLSERTAYVGSRDTRARRDSPRHTGTVGKLAKDLQAIRTPRNE